MEIEDYIENLDLVETIKEYMNSSPKTIEMFRKHDYSSLSGIYKKTELLFCIYCCKLIIILNKNWNGKKDINFSKYCDLVLSLYLNFFISSWKIACNMNISDDDMMIVLKEERNPEKFYIKIMDQLN